MRARLTVGVVLVSAVFGLGTLTSRAGEQTGRRQWTIVNFMNPVQVQDRIVMGPVLIVHDEEKMAKGEPCTTFYRFDTATGPQKPIVSFHCRPEARDVVSQTTFAYGAPAQPTGCKRLLSYQIAGDTQAHGIPGK